MKAGPEPTAPATARLRLGAPQATAPATASSTVAEVYDFGQPERSVFVVSTGQSGNPLSSHYEDYAEPWRDGRYLPMLTER